MLRDLGMILLFLALFALGYAFELGKYGVEPGLEIFIIILLGLGVLTYQKSSFYPNRLRHLPKDRLFCVLTKNRKGDKFIFTIAELGPEGVLDNKRKLVHPENIMEPYFRVSPNGDLEVVSMK